MAFKELYIESNASRCLSCTIPSMIPSPTPPPGNQDPLAILRVCSIGPLDTLNDFM